MLLRALLVCLVICLGLELPTRAEVTSLVDSGRNWCTIRAEEWDARMPDDMAAFSADQAAAAPAAEDAAFASVMDETAATFAADLAPAAADRAFESLVDETAVTFAADLALNAAPAPEAAPSAVTVEEEPGSRERRLAEAVRLTGRAVHAWVDLLHGPTVAALNP